MYCEVVSIIDYYCGTGDGRGDQRVLGQKERKKEEKNNWYNVFSALCTREYIKKNLICLRRKERRGERGSRGKKRDSATSIVCNRLYKINKQKLQGSTQLPGVIQPTAGGRASACCCPYVLSQINNYLRCLGRVMNFWQLQRGQQTTDTREKIYIYIYHSTNEGNKQPTKTKNDNSIKYTRKEVRGSLLIEKCGVDTS